MVVVGEEYFVVQSVLIYLWGLRVFKYLWCVYLCIVCLCMYCTVCSMPGMLDLEGICI